MGEAFAVTRNFRKFCCMMCYGTPSSVPEGTFRIIKIAFQGFLEADQCFLSAVLGWILRWERAQFYSVHKLSVQSMGFPPWCWE